MRPSSLLCVCLCHYRKGELEVVKCLVENSNIDISVTDNSDETPLDYARLYVYPWQFVLPYALVSVFSELLCDREVLGIQITSISTSIYSTTAFLSSMEYISIFVWLLDNVFLAQKC